MSNITEAIQAVASIMTTRGINMIIAISYKMTLRPYMKPLLFVAAMTNWHWLADICFKKEIVYEGQDVHLDVR